MKIVAIIHARMSSSRLPGKVMKDLKGKSVFYHHYERLLQCPKIDKIYLATSKSALNKPLIEEAKRYGIPYYVGAEEDLLERYTTIMRKEDAGIVVRSGCDKPLLSYEVVNNLLDEYDGEDLLYITTPMSRGTGSEVLSRKALEEIRKHYRGPAISKYIMEYPYRFKIRGVEVDDELSRPEFRLTLDTEEDYKLISALYELFYHDDVPVNLREAFKYLDDHPGLANKNRFVEDTQINVYLKEIVKTPVFSLCLSSRGKYFVKNRMGEIVSHDEFLKALDDIVWEEYEDNPR